MIKALFKDRKVRKAIFTAVTVLIFVVLLVSNLVLTHFGLYNTIFFDMTPEGLYTLSDKMIDECDQIISQMKENAPNKKIKITFCTDPDYLVSSSTARHTYFMALELHNRYPDMIEVDEVNVYLNPTAVSQYKTTSLSTIASNNIIFSYGGRYRITTFDYFWGTGSSGADYYNGEYRVATIMKSIAALSQPVAYFLTGHGETYYDPSNPESEMSLEMASFASLLVERGMEIKLLDLSTLEDRRIPEDCALLIINNPREDFTYDEDRLNEFAYVSDTEVIDRYLVDRQGAIMVAKDYRTSLPVLERFLYEWGFKFSDTVLKDEAAAVDESKTQIIAAYNTDSDSYGYQLYGEYADLTSAPLTLFSDSGSVECAFKESISSGEPGNTYASRNYASFLTTSASAQRYVRDEDGEITSQVDGVPGRYDLAALIIRNELDSEEKIDRNSFIFCVNSKSFLSSEILGNESYANYDIVSAVVENISRIDEYADMNLGGSSFNSSSLGGKLVIPITMSEQDVVVNSNNFSNSNDPTSNIIKENHGISSVDKTVITCIVLSIPLAIGITGIVVCLKRRYL